MRSSRLFATTAAAALAIAFPSVASAQTAVDCSIEGDGSAAGLPAECEEEPEVLGEVEERGDDEPAPQPAPIPVTAPEVLTATGVDSDVLALGAVGALAVGGAAVWASRRKRVDA